jgi:hypothetical protein
MFYHLADSWFWGKGCYNTWKINKLYVIYFYIIHRKLKSP